ncbi:MAG: DUF3568 domain-containing protein [Phycisphaerales bacterium]|nr:DUF3568 domain-containing protein [Phycisphaerales bacterium]MCI0629349.1 DUF3568 domain-containing protein [Phycisphaerales bacterium]MCI0674344.1 DUF3568 domain-containing protein [Phycisphaerales bacterium]
MTRIWRIVMSFGVVLFCAVGLLAGCSGQTKSGTSYSKLPNGELQMYMQSDLRTIHDKAVVVLRDQFGYKIEKHDCDALAGQIVARTARNERISVETYKHADNSTKVQVSAGFGNEYVSREILSELEASFPAMRTTTTTTATGATTNK